ncbi:hypothetical protein BAUCODRAFT_220107 [Baudoinia panamericana UAMH 10762]|uniref:Uncharacterized protein n=1 Tax=Baudoinia panamericana (strain UAMH 10762) TaxID=717646 RepID=M2MC54_BAUPA|nr:uncharacterized protein BAUCODRAFT_220107 [Baudoinia panamericana UAMH 10762]EMC94076.1 hypothetical protein BAUCODRAFT_220107 [Baudoinia panamericana UAMH 10762]
MIEIFFFRMIVSSMYVADSSFNNGERLRRCRALANRSNTARDSDLVACAMFRNSSRMSTLLVYCACNIASVYTIRSTCTYSPK